MDWEGGGEVEIPKSVSFFSWNVHSQRGRPSLTVVGSRVGDEGLLR